MKGRVFVWLIRHPMLAVVIALSALAIVAFGLAGARSGRGDDPAPDRPVTVVPGTAQSRLPKPTQFPPKPRVEEMHRALHAMGRACKTPISRRDPATVSRPVELMERFARDYADGGFTIDGEAGSTLSLLVVLRYELQDCDPSMVPGVEKLLPERFRDPS